MRKLICLIVLVVFLVMSGTAIAWDFSDYSSSFGSTFSQSQTQITTPKAYSFGYSTATAFGDYTYTKTSSTSQTYGSSFSVSAYGYAQASSSFDCGDPDPEPCEDTDQDGICNDEDNCLEYHNPEQLDWDQNGIGDVCDPTGCDGYQLPECPTGSPPTPGADCTPQYPEVGICEPAGCPPGMDDDQDGICDPGDECPDSQPEDVVGWNGCSDPEPCDDQDQDGECDEWDECPDTELGDIVDQYGCSLAQECPCSDEFIPGGPGLYQTCIVDWAQSLVENGIIDPGIGCFSEIAGQAKCGSPVGPFCDPGHAQYDPNDIGEVCPPWTEPIYDVCFEVE